MPHVLGKIYLTGCETRVTADRKLTLFTIPKAFEGPFAVIQENALESWSRLRPECNIILVGDEKGVEDTARKGGFGNVKDVRRNAYGTPLLDDAFHQVAEQTDTPYLGYVNADILLLNDFTNAFARLSKLMNRFVMVGQRRNMDVPDRISFDPFWEERMRRLALETGALYAGIDYFVFNRNLFLENIPPFAVGRLSWDNWFLYAARQRGAAVVDVTQVVLTIHQNHVYPLGGWKPQETERNLDLLGGPANLFTLSESTHILRADGLVVRCRSCYPNCVCNPLNDWAE
jgi:hypothetical protein